MEKMKTCWLLLSILLACSKAAKILVVFPAPGRSHANLGDGIVRHLLKAGHEVTYITPLPPHEPPANLRLIDVSSNFDVLPKNIFSIQNFMTNKAEPINIPYLVGLMTDMSKHTIANANVQKLINDSKEHFDAVIVEWLFSEVPAGFAAVFNCPLIWLSSVEPHWLVLRLIDEPSNPAYTTDMLSPYSRPLSFVQRFMELWAQINIQFHNYMWLDNIQKYAYESMLAPIILKQGKKPPAFNDVRFNASMMFSNAYLSTSAAIPLPQSHKFIGGYHIDDNVKPLPKDLKKIMDNAKHGVIYFSMGSNLKSKDMPEELKISLLNMFGTLKQTVLWKFEEVSPNLPPNVHILEWAPQTAILAHPNLAVFITHGGLLSTTEAIHFGVPIIGIPVFLDQFMNIDKAVSKGFALKVDLSNKIAGELKTKILEITTNIRYRETAKELSFIHHDRPVKPGQELVHWVNHVINTGGAPHLRSPAVDLPFYTRKFVDIIIIFVIIILILFLYICTFAYIKLFKNKTERKNKKTN